MRGLLVLAVLLAVVVLGGVFFVATPDDGPDEGSLEQLWISDTKREVAGNHHVPAVDDGTVYAPISGRANTAGCALVALRADDGSARWRAGISPAACTIHSVADPTVADVDGDGTGEVLAATTERALIGFDPETGDREFAYGLRSYGYTRPLVADLAGDDAPEIAVVDTRGRVSVIGTREGTVWTRDLSAYVTGQPRLADFDGDGDPELVVGTADGDLWLLGHDGGVVWNRSVEGSINWLTADDLDGDGRPEPVAGTDAGGVVTFDGRDGSVEWRTDLGRLAAVHAVGDGDDDGDVEVYATARDGRLRSLDGRDGSVEWTTRLTDADVQMTPPPVLGDVGGDDGPELVAVTNDGIVRVVAPATGRVLATHERNATVYARPTLADLNDDADREIVVIYGDGRVTALDYDG